MATSSHHRSATSTAAPLVRPRCTIHPTAIIGEKAQLIGPHNIDLGENVIIQPHAQIRAEHGNVSIGRNSTVAERAVVGVEKGGDEEGGDVIIGANVSIEGSAVVEAFSIGDGSVVEVKSKVRKGAVLGKWCKVAAMSTVEPGEELQDFVVVFGDGKQRIDATMKGRSDVRDAKDLGHEKMMDLLRKLIPNAAAKWA